MENHKIMQKKNPFLCDYLYLSSILAITKVYFTYIILRCCYNMHYLKFVFCGVELCAEIDTQSMGFYL